LINANIRTLDKRGERADALAVSGDRIIAVGKNADIRKLIAEGTRVMDAGGKLVIPGFNDAHVHFTGIGNKFSRRDVREFRSKKEIVARISYFARFLPEHRWIMARGWDPTRPDALPTK